MEEDTSMAKFKIEQNIILSIFDALPMAIYLMDENKKLLWANNTLREFVDKSCFGHFEKKECFRLIFKRDIPCIGCPADRAFINDTIEFSEIRNDSEENPKVFLITTIPLKLSGKKTNRNEKKKFMVEMIQDITFQKKVEDELRRLNDFNKAIIDNAPVAIFTIDKTGKFMSVNPALAILSGLGAEAEEKLLKFNWLNNKYTINCGLAEYIKKGLEGEPFELQDFPFTNYRGDKGQYIHFRGVPLRGNDGNIECLLCIIEDNTEKVKAKIQSIQDAKMSVIGRLMTGVAHELNNPLATIVANSELAFELFKEFKKGSISSEDLEDLESSLDVIQQQAFRCKNIIKDMIDLTKKEGFEAVKIDISQCLNEILDQINFKKLKIVLIKDISQNLPLVKGDLNAMKQCLSNIIQNAIDAVEERDNGIIIIRSYALEDSVIVEVEDNGVGIHESLIDRIFEPFFSTKETEKGVGLGLTLCYEFLHRMGGKIDVKSSLGKGSIFRISLPALEEYNQALIKTFT